MADRPTSDDSTEPTGAPIVKPKATRVKTTAAERSMPDPKPARTPKPAASRPAAATPQSAPLPSVAVSGTVVDPAGAALMADAEPEVLNVRGGGISVARATHIDVRQGGISRVEAKDVAVSMGGIAIARAERVSAEMSGVGLALAGEAHVSQSFVRALFARDVRIDQGAVWSLAAGRVTFERSSIAGVVIAGRVEGNVKPLLDWRGALALAGVLGLVVAIVRRR